MQYLVNVTVMVPCNAQIFVEADTPDDAIARVSNDEHLSAATWEVTDCITAGDISDAWVDDTDDDAA